MLLLAGVGWKDGLVGDAHVGAGRDSQAGYTLQVETPVIVRDLRTESRFTGPALLTDHDVVSGMSVSIPGVDGAYGVLGVHCRRRYEFTDEDGQFLQSVANVLGGAVRNRYDRRQLERVQFGLEEQVRVRTAQLRELASEITVSEQRERRRISKLLHDHLQQLLVAAKMRLQYDVSEGVEAISQEVHALIDESLAASRSLALDLSPPVLQDSGLRPSVAWLARQMEGKHALQVQIVGDDDGDLPDDLKAFAFEAVRELLFNVVKHSGQLEATVDIRRAEGNRLEVCVCDPGVGMSEDALREARPRPDGMGLFSIRERLDHLGGKINLESPPGGDFVVRMLLPAEEDAAARDVDPLPVPVPAAQSEDDRPDGSRIRVVVVDDHEMVRRGVTRTLASDPNVDVIGEAENGLEAIEIVRRLRPEVVLMDVNMPKVDGVEATRQLSAAMPALRIIGLSMHLDPEVESRMRSAGACDYVTKDAPSKTLRTALYRAAGIAEADDAQRSAG